MFSPYPETADTLFLNLIKYVVDAVIIINDQQRILWFNPGAERILGYTADEVIGQPLDMLFPPGVAERHQQHVQHFLSAGVTGRQMGEFMRLVAQRKNGEQFFVEATISKSQDEERPLMMAILRDVTDARRREEELLYQANLLDSIADAVIIIDSHQMIRRFNRGAETIFGYESYEVIGERLETLFPPDLATRHHEYVKEFAQVGATSRRMGEFMLLTAYRKNGETFPVEATISKAGAGEDTMMMVILRDVTDARRREEELRHAMKKERELNELRTQFVSIVSHEFRTPLAIIMSSGEILARYLDRLDETRRSEHISKIIHQTHHMKELLDDVLFIESTNSERIKFHPVPLNLELLCSMLFSEHRSRVSAGIDLQFVVNDDFADAQMDERLVQQIVDNLLSNAIRYSPSGGLVMFTLQRKADEAIITVQDQGIGIPPDEITKIFEPFTRAKNAKEIRGTGLGLAIVHNSVELHKGSIQVESKVGSGTIFTVKLPLFATE